MIQQDVFNEIQNIKNGIIAKGGTVAQANTNVSLPELTAGVATIPTGGTSYKIRTAELPNITIGLYDNEDALIENKSTGANGGLVEFELSTAGTYNVKAIDVNNIQLWTKTIIIDEIGIYDCKVSKALNDYTWAEIETASNGGYAKYMWSVGDYKDLSSFLGQTSSTYTRAVVLGFEHDNKADGTGKAGITFKLPHTSATYKHFDTNVNGVSWIGSLIRVNCLKTGEDRYVYDSAVSSSSTGTYYILNADNETFTEVTLPGAFVSGQKYYTKTTLTENGAFIDGLPSDLVGIIKQVKKETWGGYGLSAGSGDNTIIKTKDWMFALSDGEVFGNSNRQVNYSKFALEEDQYEYFKKYEENRFRQSTTAWLRSPTINYSNSFCYWNTNGCVTYNYASSTNRAALCFCI